MFKLIDLAKRVRDVRFYATRFRQGYDADAVDYFLHDIERKLSTEHDNTQTSMLDTIENYHFNKVRFKRGYNSLQVDRFLHELKERILAV